MTPSSSLLSSVFARLRPWLSARRLPLLAAILGAALTAPSLFTGLATEDFVQEKLVQHGDYHIPWRVNLFGHDKRSTPEEIAKRNYDYELYGWFPWLTDPHFDASFWRPLASFTHHFDYLKLANHPGLMHAESIAWYAALVWAVALLYRRLVEPRWVAGLSALLYAADDAHGHPVGWLVNRNGVMATFFAVLALWAYDRFRRDRFAWGAVLVPLFLGLGLLSAEFALCSLGYFVAHVLILDPAPRLRRLLGASTFVLTFLLWAVVYRFQGHSTHGSGLYIDPLTDPLAYTFELAERATVLLMGQFGTPPSDLWTRTGAYAQGLLVFWAAMLVWFVGWVLYPVVRRDRLARFWAVGLLLSLPPACATFTEDRLLLFAGVGAMPLIATLIASLAEPELVPSERKAPMRALAVIFLVLHAVVGPLTLPYRSLHMFLYDREMQADAQSLFSQVKPTDGAALIVVNGKNYYFMGMMPLTRAARGEATVPRMLSLAGTLEEVELRRLSETQLEVRPKYGFLSRVFNRIYRGRANAIPRMGKVTLLGVGITVSEVNQWGEPTAAIFDFALPLSSPAYRWVVWKGDSYEPFSVPPIGRSAFVGGS